MYLRTTRRKYKDKTYEYYFLVEAVSTPKGPRQKVICSLGDLSPRPASEWLKLVHRVEDTIAGQVDFVNDADDADLAEVVRRVRQGQQGEKKEPRGGAQDLVAVHADSVSTERHREAGPVHVGAQFWDRLGLDEVLGEAGLSERTRLLTCAMVMNRLISPSSELAMPGWIRRTALGDILGASFEELAEDALYRNLDRLHPSRGVIEKGLAERERSLFNLEGTVFFYDLTSTYFEGRALANGKARRGYSRDMRPDCAQVVIGLVVGREGFPIAHEVFEGSRQDRLSLDHMLDVLGQRVELKAGQTVVIDRGMAFAENLAQIKARGLHYIVAARQSERGNWADEIADGEGFQEVVRHPSPRNPAQAKTTVRVKMERKDGETHVLCLSEGRVEKDGAIRAKQEKRLLADLARLAKRVSNGRLKNPLAIGQAIGRLRERYPRVARYWRIEYNQDAGSLQCQRDDQRVSTAQSLDGSYLLRSDRDDLTAEEVWHTYMLLTRAENAFRNMKSPLAERPIFHQLEHRVETHIFLCVLAYHLLVAIENTLLDQNVHTSWATVRDTLSTHQVCTVVLRTSDGRTLRIRRDSTPERQHKELYKLLRVPSQIMAPKKTWSSPPPASK